jgi:hypothetical protein
MALPPDAITQTPRGYRARAYPGANRDSRDPSAAARVAASAGPPAHSPANCFDQSGSGKLTNTGATSPAASTRLAPGIVDGSAQPVASGNLPPGEAFPFHRATGPSSAFAPIAGAGAPDEPRRSFIGRSVPPPIQAVAGAVAR